MHPTDQLWTTVHARLRHVAAHLLARERSSHTLQPTALVHEAWLRLHDDRASGERSDHQLVRAVAHSMRRVLLDHARGVKRRKRTPPGERVPPADVPELGLDAELVLDLDAALRNLAAISPLHARIVELRFFAGLTEVETAASLGISRRTVQKSFRSASSYLRTQLDATAGE